MFCVEVICVRHCQNTMLYNQIGFLRRSLCKMMRPFEVPLASFYIYWYES